MVDVDEEDERDEDGGDLCIDEVDMLDGGNEGGGEQEGEDDEAQP